VKKEAKELVRAAERQGWTLEQGAGGHPKLVSPDGRHKVPFSQNARGSYVETERHLRQLGFVPPRLRAPRKKKRP